MKGHPVNIPELGWSRKLQGVTQKGKSTGQGMFRGKVVGVVFQENPEGR